MPFVEIEPTQKQSDRTGARVTKSERNGLTITLSGDALAAIVGGGDVERVTVLLDWDTTAPRIRITANPEGKFKLRTPTGRASTSLQRTVRAGHRPEWAKADDIHGADCVWESPEPGTVDVDLPRELVKTVQAPSATQKPPSLQPVRTIRAGIGART
jgi:hypothetical protein